MEIGIHNDICLNYINSKNIDIKYLKSDLSLKVLNKETSSQSNKVCFDNDIWTFSENSFDLIISNFYLHLSDEISTLFKNINFSLKPNGFFLCAIPGNESLKELRDCMMIADQDFYQGVYQRFNYHQSIDKAQSLLKENNFKLSLIDNEYIELRYQNFNDLIKDIKRLGQSYLYLDKKQIFENKKYFNKVEEIYWKKYSKNDKLYCKHQIMRRRKNV